MSADPVQGRPRPASGRAESQAPVASPRLRIAETFVSLQGEGSRTGFPTAFVRLTGCALRCRWCDTEWAFTGGTWRTVDEIVQEVSASGVRHVCVTGGEPLLQRDVVPLVERLACELGLDVVVETGGDQDISVLPDPVVRILDVKLPGSGMADRFDPGNFDRLRGRDEVKMVVADRHDYEHARDLVRGRLAGFPGEILLSPVTNELSPDRLAAWVLADALPVRVQLQLHKLIWPGRERGV